MNFLRFVEGWCLLGSVGTRLRNRRWSSGVSFLPTPAVLGGGPVCPSFPACGPLPREYTWPFLSPPALSLSSNLEPAPSEQGCSSEVSSPRPGAPRPELGCGASGTGTSPATLGGSRGSPGVTHVSVPRPSRLRRSPQTPVFAPVGHGAAQAHPPPTLPLPRAHRGCRLCRGAAVPFSRVRFCRRSLVEEFTFS